MSGQRNKSNLYLDSNPGLRNQSSLQSIGSPGSVYDQYFDADSDGKTDGFSTRRLRNQSSLNQVMSYNDLLGSETETEGEDIQQTSNTTPVPITSFDSTAGEENSELDDEDYEEDSQGGVISEEEAPVAPLRQGRRQSIVEAKEASIQKARATLENRKSIIPTRPPPLIPPQQDDEDEEEVVLTPPPPGMSVPRKAKPTSAKPQTKVESREKYSPTPKAQANDRTKPSPAPAKKQVKKEPEPEPEPEPEEEEEEDEGGEGIFDYYDILSVEKDCPTEKVVEQYKKEIVMAEFERLTPDGKARIREVAEAYFVLTDPKKRAMYDKTIDEEDMSLVPQWKPASPIDPDYLLSEVFADELLKELFKPAFYFTPMSYVAGAVIGFILLSWPGLVVFAYFAGRVGDWEDNRPPPARQLVAKLTDNQRTALMHALTRVVF